MAGRTIDLRERIRLRHIPAGRTLHLVDLENLAGGPRATAAEVDATLRAYAGVVRFGAADLRVVACAKGLWAAAKAAWPGAQVKAVGRSADAADLALLAESAPTYVRRHFDRVVIASGDHIFSERVIELDAAGVDVCVVAPRRGLARQLAAAAPVVRYLDEGWASLKVTV